MSSELNLCPFCGGEARFEIDTDGSFMLEVEHEPGCFLTSTDTRHWYYCETVEEAAEDWNQRATPIPDTPEMVEALDNAYEAGRKSAERTCKVVNKIYVSNSGLVHGECGNCRVTLHGFRNAENTETWNSYCHNCGTKLVG